MHGRRPRVAAGRRARQTTQDQRVVVHRVDDDHLTLKWAARCADVGVERDARRARTVFSPHDGRERLLTLTRDGDRYTGRGRWRQDGTDGDYDLVTATATARVADGGRRLTGTLTAEWKSWNGEGRAFDGTCTSGDVSWRADAGTPERATTSRGLDGWINGDGTTTDGRTVWALLRPAALDSADP